MLSESIMKETKRYLSETTIKRFYGFAKVNHQYSSFTLDTLCLYSGFNNWYDFIEQERERNAEASTVWKAFSAIAHELTTSSVNEIRNRSTVPYRSTTSRPAISRKLDDFRKSDEKLVFLRGDAAQGKSLALEHWVSGMLEKNETDDQEVVLFITQGTRKTRLEKDRNLSASISHQLGFSGLDQLFSHIQTHEKKHGNLLIILDGFDKFMKSPTYQSEFGAFLDTMSQFEYIKTIVSLRAASISLMTTGLLAGSNASSDSPVEKAKYIDVEELSSEEILKVINSLQQSKIEIEMLEPSLLELLRKPLFLGTYSILITIEKNIQPFSKTVFYRLLHLYFQNRIFLGRNSSNKVLLLKNIAGQQDGYHVDEIFLINLDDLIEDGTIVPLYDTNEHKNAHVHFASENLRSYFLYLTLRDQWSHVSDTTSFYHFLKAHQQITNLSLLEWAIFYACKDRDLKPIQDLFFTGCPKVCGLLLDFLSTLLLELNKSREISLDNVFNDGLIHILLSGDQPADNIIELLYLFSNDLSSPEKTFYANIILAKNLISKGNTNAVTQLLHNINRGREIVKEKFLYNPVLLIKEMVNFSKKEHSGIQQINKTTDDYQNLVRNFGLTTIVNTPNVILEKLFQQYFKMSN